MSSKYTYLCTPSRPAIWRHSQVCVVCDCVCEYLCCHAILQVDAQDAERLLQCTSCSGALARVSLSPIGDLTIILTEIHLIREKEDSKQVHLKLRRAGMRNIAAHFIQRILLHLQLVVILPHKAIELAKINERVMETLRRCLISQLVYRSPGCRSTQRATRRLHLAIQVQRLLAMCLCFLVLGILVTVHHEHAHLIMNLGQFLLQYHQLGSRDAIAAALRRQP